MRKILLLLILSVSAIFAQAQNVAGDELRIYKSAQIGEDGTLNYLDMHGNVIKNVKDPVNLQDVVTLKYLQDNVVTGDVEFVDFQVNELNPAYKQARLWYDSLRAEIVFYDRVVDLKFGTVGEVSIRVLNNSGGDIVKGKAVYPTGSSGGFTTIGLAQANSYVTSRPVGFAKNTMLNGEEGWVMLKGVLEDVNTSTLSGGVAYLSPTSAGDLTNTLPSGGDFIIRMGAIGAIGVSDGVINVDPFTNEYTAETISPRGWPMDVVNNTILAPSSGTRTFTIIGDGYVYESGIRYDFSNPSVIWDDTEGTVDVYFDEGVLTAASNLTESEVRDLYSIKPGASRMYWDALNDTIIYANTMRHTFDMNGNTWAALWDYHKCEIIDGGLGLVEMSVDGSGNVDASAQFGNASALIRNQDIITVVPSQVGTVGYTVFYRDGLGGNWRSQDGAPFGILTTGTGRAAWNEDVAGTWQLTETTSGNYVPYVFLTSNTLGDKTGTIMPSAQYATIAEAETGAVSTIGALLQGLPIKELKSVAIVIYETRINYTNAVQSRIVSTTTGDDYIDLRFENIVGGGSSGTTSSYIGLTDTQNTYAGFAGQFPVVNPGETGLDFANAVQTVNGESSTLGNYNITSTANKIGEDVTIGTGGTGNDAVFSVADNDADPTNENQDLGNSKLNNDVTVTISSGTNTTISNLSRIDFANDYDFEQSVNGNVIFNAGNSNNTGTSWTANNLTADGTILANSYITTSLGGGLALSGENSPTSATIGHNYIDIDGVDVAPTPSASSWKQTFTNSGTEKWSLAYRAAAAGAGVFTDYIDVDVNGVLNSLGGYKINDTDINTAGTLNNVAYLDQSITFESSGQVLSLKNSDIYSTVPFVEINPILNYNSTSNFTTFSKIRFSKDNAVDGDTGGYTAFYRKGNGVAVDEGMRLKSSGDLDLKIGGYQIAGTTVIDPSRNIVNAGTGSFGGIVKSFGFQSDATNNTFNLMARTAGTALYAQRENAGTIAVFSTGSMTAGAGTVVATIDDGGLSVNGTATATNVFNKATQTLSGTTPTYNTSTSVNAKITLTGNTTMTLSNLVDGMSGNLRVNNGAGSFTLTLSPTPKVINGGAGVVTLTGTASAVDIISWWYDGTNLNVTYGLNFN